IRSGTRWWISVASFAIARSTRTALEWATISRSVRSCERSDERAAPGPLRRIPSRGGWHLPVVPPSRRPLPLVPALLRGDLRGPPRHVRRRLVEEASGPLPAALAPGRTFLRDGARRSLYVLLDPARAVD